MRHLMRLVSRVEGCKGRRHAAAEMLLNRAGKYNESLFH